MPEFKYDAVDKTGKNNRKLEAASEGDLRMALRGDGHSPH